MPEAGVRELLYEAGSTRLPPPMTSKAIVPSARLATPETYLNLRRQAGFAVPLRPGVHFYPGVINPTLNEFALRGTWRISSEAATPDRPISALDAGADVRSGAVTVQGQRLYSLVSLPGVRRHDLTVDVPAGVSAYDFTFG